MSVNLKTNCKDCVHEKVCKYKGNAESDFEKFIHMQYGTGLDDDYSWEVMLKANHVDVEFSCPDFSTIYKVNGFKEDKK